MTTLTSNYKDGSVFGARLHRFRAVVTLASQAVGTVDLGMRIPPGHVFAYGVLNSDTSLGTSTVAIGISGSTAKYKAAGTFTATNTPTLFGANAAVASTSHTSSEVGSSPLGEGTNEDIIATVAVAALPASGTLVVDLYFSCT
ncbi:hypothetical protein CN085_19730 [Sinorhizobium meliloti]|uniref:hypothetical protein n=1 Tax=Rhizobium meliloti TaxID=382 RepID=UPI000B4A3EF3|nr:hypothetical protein [Sinorhizobium meliloti]MDX1117030.1 hypothetical protein [Sinorhizobium medicae]ASQ11841.1 hypothetical protein CDO22_17765 [Sinorhizobium meliloti]MQU83609.1 hypothetical protein [Sinorhizobium meliloti]MQX90306.1 hypothetical protein [Sinorhizobium meliloti]RVP13145.1 hypothetical protein CN085_19730 [Sinorhizobium meliloti]